VKASVEIQWSEHAASFPLDPELEKHLDLVDAPKPEPFSPEYNSFFTEINIF
jgi:hypothetical protein